MRRWSLLTLAIVATGSTPAGALEARISLSVDTPERPAIMGVTTLPDQTELLIEIRRKQSRYFAQSKAKVANGQFRSEQFSQGGVPLNPGEYQVEVTMPLAGVQPPAVQRIIGSEGEQLRGSQVQRTKFGTTVVAKTVFKVGTGADSALDAQARAKAALDMDKWIVENCNSIVAMTNSFVRGRVVSGKEFVGVAQEERVNACIADLRKRR